MWCDVQILSFYSFTHVFRDLFTLCGSWIHEIRRSCVTNHLVSVFRPIRVWTCHWAHRRVQPAAEVHLQDTPFMSSSQTLNVFCTFMFQRCAYGQRHLVRVQKRSCLGLKYIQTWLETVQKSQQIYHIVLYWQTLKHSLICWTGCNSTTIPSDVSHQRLGWLQSNNIIVLLLKGK